jgi:hypothetical protein
MAKAKTSAKNQVPGMFKNMLGVQATGTATSEDQLALPPGYEKRIEGVAVKPMSTREVFAAAGKDLLGNLGTWWKEGSPTEEEKDLKTPKKDNTEKSAKIAKEKREKDTVAKKADKETLEKLTTLYSEGNSILSKMLNEISLLRKITEGSVKFEKTGKGNKARAAYRDTITGKAAAVKPTITTPGMAVAGTTAKPLASQTGPIQPAQEAAAPEESGSLTGKALDVLPDLIGKKPPIAGPASVPSPAAGGGFLSKAARFMGGKGGLITAGVAGAIGGGMYAYDKFSQASNEKQAEVMAAQDQLKSGEITKEEFNKKVEEADKKSVITKGEGIGGGAGRFGGAVAGAKLGASFGTFFGPAGTVVGGLAGGALGYMAGGSIGEAVGNIGGRISNFFGGNSNKEENNIQTNNKSLTTKSSSFSVSSPQGNIEGIYTNGKYYINGQEVSEKEYREVREKYGVSKADNPMVNKMMAGKGTSLSDLTGNASESARNLLPTSASQSGALLSGYSVANRDLAALQNAGGTTVINNNSSGSPGPSQPGIIPLKPQIRPEASTLTRYVDRVAAY